MMAALLSALLFAFIARSSSSPAQIGILPKKDTSLKDTTDSKFHVGDVWQYKTRPGEEKSRLIVVKIDDSPDLGVIIHVAVDGLTWKDCEDNLVAESVPHMPFARRAVEESVTKRVGKAESLPNFRNGYEEWQQAYYKKHAGIYAISVEAAVSVTEKTWRAGIGCPPTYTMNFGPRFRGLQ